MGTRVARREQRAELSLAQQANANLGRLTRGGSVWAIRGSGVIARVARGPTAGRLQTVDELFGVCQGVIAGDHIVGSGFNLRLAVATKARYQLLALPHVQPAQGAEQHDAFTRKRPLLGRGRDDLVGVQRTELRATVGESIAIIAGALARGTRRSATSAQGAWRADRAVLVAAARDS